MGKKFIGSAALTPSSDSGFDLTTKGDTHGYSDTNARIPIGSNDQVLTADSAQALGLKWATPSVGGGNMEFIERFTATASSTFTCTLSSSLAVGNFVKMVGIWNGKWNASGSASNLELQIVTPVETIDAGYSWAANVLTSSSTFTAGSDVDNFTIGASATAAASRGNIMFELTHLSVPSAQNNELYFKWWQVGTNVQQAWGSGFTYQNENAITAINGFIFTNGTGNNIESGTTLDVYKVTS